mmetsp:Transcript_29778/g.68737  ORF Transcript_29778/g.68737 Transcript_29778/m.68737 type:complete len:119 (-) Transcript_29778:561-917(-)
MCSLLTSQENYVRCIEWVLIFMDETFGAVLQGLHDPTTTKTDKPTNNHSKQILYIPFVKSSHQIVPEHILFSSQCSSNGTFVIPRLSSVRGADVILRIKDSCIIPRFLKRLCQTFLWS